MDACQKSWEGKNIFFDEFSSRFRRKMAPLFKANRYIAQNQLFYLLKRFEN